MLASDEERPLLGDEASPRSGWADIDMTGFVRTDGTQVGIVRVRHFPSPPPAAVADFRRRRAGAGASGRPSRGMLDPGLAERTRRGSRRLRAQSPPPSDEGAHERAVATSPLFVGALGELEPLLGRGSDQRTRSAAVREWRASDIDDGEGTDDSFTVEDLTSGTGGHSAGPVWISDELLGSDRDAPPHEAADDEEEGDGDDPFLPDPRADDEGRGAGAAGALALIPLPHIAPPGDMFELPTIPASMNAAQALDMLLEDYDENIAHDPFLPGVQRAALSGITAQIREDQFGASRHQDSLRETLAVVPEGSYQRRLFDLILAYYWAVGHR